MAPKRAAAEAPAEQPEAKRLTEALRRSGVTRADFTAVVNGIQMSDLPAGVRAMLVAVLPSSLFIYADERAPQQEKMVAMLGDAMDQVQTQLQKAIDMKKCELERIEESGSGLRKEFEDATDACARATSASKVAKEQLDAARDKASQCHAAWQEKRASHDKAIGEREELTADQDLFETVLASEFEQLKKGELPASADEVKSLIGSVQQLANKATLDVSLEATWAGVFGKTERTGFDNVVVEQLEKCLREKSVAIATAKDAINSQIGELSAAVRSLAVDAEAARLHQDSLDSEWNAARDEESAAAGAVAKAQAALDTLAPSIQTAANAMKAGEDELQKFHAKTVTVFDALKQRVSPKMQKQAAAKAAAEAAAKVAAEASAEAVAAAAEEAAIATDKEQLPVEAQLAQQVPQPEDVAKPMVTEPSTQAEVARAAVAEAGA